jgi:hypothetical protein
MLSNGKSMTCPECIEWTTVLHDEIVNPIEERLYRDHLAVCPTCARYQRVLTRGLRLVRELPGVEPSTDFTQRLGHRLSTLDEARVVRERSALAGAVVSIAVAGLVALAAWTPILRRPQAQQTRALPVATVIEDDAPAMPEPGARGFLGNAVPLGLSSYMRRSVPPPPSLTTAFPGPYSPLVVQPPAIGRPVHAGRTTLVLYHVE